MKDMMLFGLLRHAVPVPGPVWRAVFKKTAPKEVAPAVAFMTDEHHKVRDFVVCEIPRVNKPVSPKYIAEKLGMSEERVKQLLDEMEPRLAFVYRAGGESVVWAYPVTAVQTTGSRSAAANLVRV